MAGWVAHCAVLVSLPLAEGDDKFYYFSVQTKLNYQFYETSPYAAPGKKKERQGRKGKEKIYTVDYMNK